MNAAFNHGSQGDLYERGREKSQEQKRSTAPLGTGAKIRAAALDGDLSTLTAVAIEWKGDPVLNEPDEIGTTPLHTAASHGHFDCVTVLLENGADKTIKNNYGQTPYVRILHKCHSNIQKLFLSIAPTRLHTARFLIARYVSKWSLCLNRGALFSLSLFHPSPRPQS
jgi:hypothetical protein